MIKQAATAGQILDLSKVELSAKKLQKHLSIWDKAWMACADFITKDPMPDEQKLIFLRRNREELRRIGLRMGKEALTNGGKNG